MLAILPKARIISFSYDLQATEVTSISIQLNNLLVQDTPNRLDGVSASGAPFVQKKRGNLRHALLDNAYREAAARVDLVGTFPPYHGDSSTSFYYKLALLPTASTYRHDRPSA